MTASLTKMHAVSFFVLLSASSVIAEVCYLEGCHCNELRRSATCRHVYLETVPVLPDWLETLDLEGCHLLELNMIHAGVSSLRELRMPHVGIAMARADAFINIAHTLRILDISGNRLRHSTLNGALSTLSNLEVLDLSNNEFDNVDHIVDMLPNDAPLRRLDISNNPLKYASATTAIPHVSELIMNDIDSLVMANDTTLTFASTERCSEHSCRTLQLGTKMLSNIRELSFAECKFTQQRSICENDTE